MALLYSRPARRAAAPCRPRGPLSRGVRPASEPNRGNDAERTSTLRRLAAQTRPIAPAPRGTAAMTLALAAALLAPLPAHAASKTWVGGTSTWNNAAAWSPSGQPAANDGAYIYQGGASVTYSNTTNPSAVLGSMRINAPGGATFSQAQHALNTAELLVGDDAAGTVIQSGGTLNVTGPTGLTLGQGATGSGTYAVSGSAVLTVTGQINVGDTGTGSFSQSGGQVTVSNLGTFPGALSLGSNPGSRGTYSIFSGTLSTGAVYVAPYGGTATFTQSGGTVNLSDELGVGNIDDGTIGGKADVQHTAGTLTVAGSLRIGRTGAVKHAGGTLRTGGLAIDLAGGKLDLANQSMVVDYDPALGSPLATVRAAVASGYQGGAWTGSGIVSSNSAAQAARSTGIGYAEATAALGLGVAGSGTWQGQAVDGSSLLVRYTLYGDSDLDGQVGFSDLLKVAQAYGATGKDWVDGDSNYDGTIGFADLLAVAQNYQATLPAAAEALPGATEAFAADYGAALAMVPEPALGGLALGAVAACLGRRRRRTA